LPKDKERKDIFKIHMKKRNLNYLKFNVDEFAKRSDFFSGSEIEQVVVSALYRGFYLNRAIENEDFFNIIEEIIPFYNTYEESIKELKKWAETKARKASFNDEAYEMFE
jgi:SpoVK/Ycf46/Vps4 family AAA+-type ATPase